MTRLRISRRSCAQPARDSGRIAWRPAGNGLLFLVMIGGFLITIWDIIAPSEFGISIGSVVNKSMLGHIWYAFSIMTLCCAVLVVSYAQIGSVIRWVRARKWRLYVLCVTIGVVVCGAIVIVAVAISHVRG